MPESFSAALPGRLLGSHVRSGVDGTRTDTLIRDIGIISGSLTHNITVPVFGANSSLVKGKLAYSLKETRFVFSCSADKPVEKFMNLRTLRVLIT